MASVSNASFLPPSALAYKLQKSQSECHHSPGRVVSWQEKGLSLSSSPVSCLVIVTFVS